MSKLVVLVRHGQGEHNITGRLNGLASQERGAVMHLTAEGEKQIEGIASALKEIGRTDQILASPLVRAIESAEIIAAKFNSGVRVDPLLGERDFGKYDGMKIEEIIGTPEPGDTRSEQERATLWVRQCIVDGHELESSERVQERMRAFLQSVKDGNTGVTIGVTHFDAIRAAVSVTLGQSELALYELNIPYGSITVVDLSNSKEAVIAVGSTRIDMVLAEHLSS